MVVCELRPVHTSPVGRGQRGSTGQFTSRRWAGSRGVSSALIALLRQCTHVAPLSVQEAVGRNNTGGRCYAQLYPHFGLFSWLIFIELGLLVQTVWTFGWNFYFYVTFLKQPFQYSGNWPKANCIKLRKELCCSNRSKKNGNLWHSWLGLLTFHPTLSQLGWREVLPARSWP